MLLELSVIGSALYAIGKVRPKKKILVKQLTSTQLPSPVRSQIAEDWLSTAKASVQAVKEERFGLFFSNTRRRQMEEITQGEYVDPAQSLYWEFHVSLVNAGIALTSLLFYPPLIVLTIPGLIVGLIPTYRHTYQRFKNDRVASSYLTDIILFTGLITGGYFYAASFFMPVNLLIHILIRKTEDHSKRSLTNLFGEQPRSIWVVVDDVEVEIPFEKLERNAIIVISAGQMIPVDGTIISGTASIDQHRLTGESQPVEKGIGDAVIASTVLLAGKIHVQTEKTGKQTVAAQIGQILEQTTDFKTTMRSRGEIISDRLTIPTLAISALAYPFLGSSSALAVLSNTIGYKMRVFAPIGMLSFLHIASEKGILIKDGRSLELLNQIDTFVFDKTGTLTMEQPHVSGIHPCAEIEESDLLRYAAAAEYGQTHPIARAILSAARTQELTLPAIEDAKYEIGYGIQVQLTERAIRVGSHKFMTMEGIAIPESMDALQERCHAQGHSVVMVAFDDQLVGAIELQPTIRPEVQQIIQQIHHRNIETYIISGDQEQPTQRLAQTLGIDHYFANTLPQNKAELVEQLQQEGRSVCFVGDGINDSIALKTASVSVSLSGATTVATDTAQIVMMDGTLTHLVDLLDLAQEFEANMKRSMLLATVPSSIFLCGILFFGWGVGAGLILTNSVQIVGISNAIRPLFKRQEMSVITAGTRV